MSSSIELKNVCQYYDALEHQDAALKYLESQLTAKSLSEFARLWRNSNSNSPPAPSLPAKAKFVMNLEKGSQLIYGALYLIDKSGKQLRSYIATSGCAGWQSAADMWVVGKGPCPNLKELQISTHSIWSPEVRGVEGHYFSILPNRMRGPNGIVRSCIGVHGDANVPGSAGCVVLKDINLFKTDLVPLFQKLEQAGVDTIPLEIVYS